LNTADVDDIIWSTSSQRGKQGGDLGRMAALDAGYDIRASGMTLARIAGSTVTWLHHDHLGSAVAGTSAS
jgi:acetyl-CoA C-acetyltransferase